MTSRRYDVDFYSLIAERAPAGAGLAGIDHLTHTYSGFRSRWFTPSPSSG